MRRARWGRRGVRVAIGASLVVVVVAGRASADSSFPDAPPMPALIGGSDEVRVIDDSPMSAAERVEPIVAHAYPIERGGGTYERTHHDYPATDIALPCGTALVAAVDGAIWEVERIDRWNPLTDIAATRGGRTVVIDGDDGVRYLYAHLSAITSTLAVGQRVAAGQRIATLGTTGRSTGCHLHLGLSPPCPTRVWDRLAGTVWPWPYLDAWRRGDNIGPGPEIERWLELHPEGCGRAGTVSSVDDLATYVPMRFGE